MDKETQVEEAAPETNEGASPQEAIAALSELSDKARDVATLHAVLGINGCLSHLCNVANVLLEIEQGRNERERCMYEWSIEARNKRESLFDEMLADAKAKEQQIAQAAQEQAAGISREEIARRAAAIREGVQQ